MKPVIGKELFHQDPLENPLVILEQSFINEYLRTQGYTQSSLRKLPRERGRQLMCGACLYASIRLAELEARMHLWEELHGP